jgi:hypothetical protein
MRTNERRKYKKFTLAPFKHNFGSVSVSFEMSFRRKPESILFALDASFRWHDIYFWADRLKLRHHHNFIDAELDSDCACSLQH